MKKLFLWQSKKKKPQIFDAVPDNKKPPKKKPDNGPKIISVILEKPKTDKPVVPNKQKPKQYTEISLGGNFGGKTLKSKTTNTISFFAVWKTAMK